MQDKIVAAIAAYLEGNNLELFQKVYASRVHSKFVQGQIDYYKLPPNQWPDDCVAIKSRREDIDFHNKQSSELIQSIAAEIAAAIAPMVEGELDWKDAPEWAEWRVTTEFMGEVKNTWYENLQVASRTRQVGTKSDVRKHLNWGHVIGIIYRRPK